MNPVLGRARERLAAAAAVSRGVRLDGEDALAAVEREAAANSKAAGAAAVAAAAAIDRSEVPERAGKPSGPVRPAAKSYVMDLGPEED